MTQQKYKKKMKKQFKTPLLLVFCGITLFLSSCCSLCVSKSPRVGDLEGVKWELVELQGVVLEESQITVSFDANTKTINGQCPCNNFFGGYVLSNDKKSNVKFGNMGATMRMCPDTEVEESFVRGISGVILLRVEGDNLLMINAEDELFAVLRKVSSL